MYPRYKTFKHHVQFLKQLLHAVARQRCKIKHLYIIVSVWIGYISAAYTNILILLIDPLWICNKFLSFD